MIKRGLNQRARHLVAMLTTHPCTLAYTLPPLPKSRLIFTTSANLHRPPPLLSPPLSSTTMSTTVDPSNLDVLFQQKKVLRTKVKKDLRSMDPTLRSQEDDDIQRIILEAPWFKSCKKLCAYISCAPLREVDTSKILTEILKDSSEDEDLQIKKKLYVPRIEDKNRNMRMLHISKLDDLIANSMDILEPAPIDCEGKDREDVLLAHEPIDLLLLPGLAFDKSGRRLGRGGGYYDTFLTRYQELATKQNWKQPLLIALSYSVQIVDEGLIPMTPIDVSIDALVSPSGLIPFSPAGFELSKQ